MIPHHAYLDRRCFILLLLGFTAGLPLMLIFSTLSLWLAEAGVDRKTVTMFSWAALAYSFKFVWAPLTDVLALPVLSRLGQRRAWLLAAQLLLILAMSIMANIDPAQGQLSQMAAAAVLLGFASATQDIVIDAYRIEIAPDDNAMQSVMSAAYTAGYRIGMIASGAGALFLAAHWGSSNGHYVYDAWQKTYLAMSMIMGIGVLTTLFAPRPINHSAPNDTHQTAGRLRLFAVFVLSACAFVFAFRYAGIHLIGRLPEGQTASPPFLVLGMETLRLLFAATTAYVTAALSVKLKLVERHVLHQTWIVPITDFFERYGRRAIGLLALIGLYRISDIVAGVVSNLFYADLGFSKEQIAAAVKTFGVLMSVAGGFAGGLLAQRIALMQLMMSGAVAAAATNWLFAVLALAGKDTTLLYIAVGLDNFAAGLAGTVFVAFLSALTNIRFTAVQYALFSSLMTLLPKTLGGYSGTMVEHMGGYSSFFIFTAVLGLPVLLLIYWVGQHFDFSVPR